MELTRIKINNFRSLKNVDIKNVKKVNIFMGKNNSGKSRRDPLNFTFDECVFSQDGNKVQDIEILLESMHNGAKAQHETHWKRDGAVATKEEFPSETKHLFLRKPILSSIEPGYIFCWKNGEK